MTQSTAYVALLLRTALGTMFIAHGLLKVLVITPAGTAGFFESLGVPGLFAYLTIGAELVGGALLVLGVQTRAVSLALLPVLVGSIVLVHGSNGWLFTNENGGWEYSAFLVLACLVQAMLGNGALSLGDLLRRDRSEMQANKSLPSLFVSHGAPDLLLSRGPAVDAMQELVRRFPNPRAIVIVSAHWIEGPIGITTDGALPTIYDFGGFPASLYEIEYPAVGNRELSLTIGQLLEEQGLDYRLDETCGLDHGA